MASAMVDLVVDDEGDNELHRIMQGADHEEPRDVEDSLFRYFTSMVNEDFRRAINVANIRGNTPLMELLSCQEPDRCLVRAAVLSLGCDVNTINNLQISPVHKIVEKLFLIPRILAQDYLFEEEKRIVDEQTNNAKEVLTILVGAGANVNQPDVFGRTPLFLANDVEIIKYLISNGADVHAVDRWGRTLLHVAVTMPNYMQLMECYVPQLRPDFINKTDVNGSTALHYAAIFGRRDAFEILKIRIDPNTMDKKGRTYFQLLNKEEGGDMISTIQGQIKAHSQLKKIDVVHFTEIMADDADLSHVINKPGSHVELCALLVDPRYGGVRDHSEASYFKESLVNFVRSICTTIGQLDSRFQSTLFRTGSSEEGTKVGDPNEFDFVFCLDRFTEICTIEEIPEMKGFAELKAKGDISPGFREFFDSNKKCSATNVRAVFGKLLRRLVMDKNTWTEQNLYFDGDIQHFMEYDRPVFTLKVCWVGCSYKDEEVSLDIVPAVRHHGWWPSSVDFSQIPVMSDEIQSEGCMLLLQNPYHQADTLMRISCAAADICLMKSLPQHFRESYRLCKVLRHKSICPAMDPDATHDTFPNFDADDCVTSYMLKNSLFHILADCQKEGLWTVPHGHDVRKLIVNISAKLLEFLYHCSVTRALPVYFLRDREDIFRFPLVEMDNSDPNQAMFLNAFHCDRRQAFAKIMLYILR